METYNISGKAIEHISHILDSIFKDLVGSL